MDNFQKDTMETEQPEVIVLSEANMDALEAERQSAKDAEIAPYIAAAKQRQHNSSVVAEHDDIFADMLYEITMNEFGTEV